MFDSDIQSANNNPKTPAKAVDPSRPLIIAYRWTLNYMVIKVVTKCCGDRI